MATEASTAVVSTEVADVPTVAAHAPIVVLVLTVAPVPAPEADEPDVLRKISTEQN